MVPLVWGGVNYFQWHIQDQGKQDRNKHMVTRLSLQKTFVQLLPPILLTVLTFS